MIAVDEAELLAMRLRYEAAYIAYRTCVKALAEAGCRPPPQLLVSEADALRELSEAREHYRDALLTLSFAPGATIH